MFVIVGKRHDVIVFVGWNGVSKKAVGVIKAQIEQIAVFVQLPGPLLWLTWHLQYSLNFVLHTSHLGMLQNMRQSFIGEPNEMTKAIPDHFHRRKIWQ